MITRATAEITNHIDKKEVDAAIIAVNAVQRGFQDDVLPHAKTFPLAGFDTVQLDILINNARQCIETLHFLIAARAKVGNGAAVVVIYHNLNAVV